jgi:predicted dehydrogenase
MLPALKKMKSLIDAGAIGDVHLIRASCAGDVLSDGTHAIDSVRYLAGDVPVRWLLGQVYRDEPNPDQEPGVGFDARGGYRYGHPVETGAIASWEFETGVRAELNCGQMMLSGRWYQDYEVFGSKGRIWRLTDSQKPNLQIQDEQGGFRAVEHDQEEDPVQELCFTTFQDTLISGEAHPLAGTSALQDMEIVTAIYESARLGKRLKFPIDQDCFPLELQLKEQPAWRA